MFSKVTFLELIFFYIFFRIDFLFWFLVSVLELLVVYLFDHVYHIKVYW